MYAQREATAGHGNNQSEEVSVSSSELGTNQSSSAAVVYHDWHEEDLRKKKSFVLRTKRFAVSKPPRYLNGLLAVILDEFTCIILAITTLIWKHVLSAVVALFFSIFLFFFWSSQSGDLGP